jgi:hypothetical protein
MPKSNIIHVLQKTFFQYFLPFWPRLASKFEKVLIRSKIKYFCKTSVRISENAEYFADFKTIEKLLKRLPKNVIYKEVFSFLVMVIKFVGL